MDRLWAPWRIEYILSEKEEGCLFCRVISEDRDDENLILYRGEKAYIILNKYPYNNG
ncbi:HIT family hydrolase, partial [Candidatus Geothermarchaeota archaeon]